MALICMDGMDLTELRDAALAAATAGADVATSWQGRGDERGIRQKSSPRDLVSRADMDAETAIRDVLHRLRPGDAVVGEEQAPVAGSSGITWYVDPIDGTTSYLYGRCSWAVSVAAMDEHGRVLAGVVAEPAHLRIHVALAGGGAWVGDQPLRVSGRDDLAHALVEANFGRPGDQRARAGDMVNALLSRVRDVQRGGSAAAAVTNVASGRADVAWCPGLQRWDAAAAILLVSEAGGLIGDLSGTTEGRWPESGDVLAATPKLWHPLREILAEVYGGPAGELSDAARLNGR